MTSMNADSLMETLKKKLNNFKTTVDSLTSELEKKNSFLKAEDEKREKAEAEVAALQRRIRLLEDDLEGTDTRLIDATSKLEEASKAADESERYRRAMQSRQMTDDTRIEALTVTLEKTIKEAEEAERKYEEAKLSLNTAENSLFMAEKRVEEAEERIRSMESELRTITTDLKSMEICESTASKQKQVYQVTLDKLSKQLAEAERRAQEAQTDTLKKQAVLSKLDIDLDAEKQTNESLRQEMENIVADLQNM